MKLAPLGEGLGFTEGPVFTQSGDLVVVSIDQGRLYRLRNGSFDVLATPGAGPNGLAEGADGRLYVAQNGGRWNAATGRPPRGATGGVQSVDARHQVEWITRDPISPNDLCFGPDGLLYVTDPTRQPLDDGRIWRCDVATGEAELVVSLHWYPNGIGFGPEDDVLYVASTRDHRIVRFPFSSSGLGKPEAFVQMPRGRPDGFAFDIDGDLAVCGVSNDELPGEVQIWSPRGELLEVIRPGSGKRYTNIAIAPDRRVAITDSDGGRVLFGEEWPSAGLLLHPFRVPAALARAADVETV